MDYLHLIDKYCQGHEQLKRILITHSESVMRKALYIAKNKPLLDIDVNFVTEAAMLHDIGIVECDATGIQCFGTQPYICHGIIGASIMRKEGFPKHARICERHTGTGLTRDDIINNKLPLPPTDYLPETIEEKLICYADKFFSKSHLERVRTVEQVAASLSKFGTNSVERFNELNALFYVDGNNARDI